jgi:hypothetical protein
MSKYKFLSFYTNSDEKYSDMMKPIKDILTDFINDYFIYNSEGEIKLLKLIYNEVNREINKYGVKLIFKGGNVMRLINNNIIKYFPPSSDKIIRNVFSNFLKFSDNDFTILINPNIENYEFIFYKINYDVLKALDRIRNILKKNESKYFYIFKLNDFELKNIKDELLEKLNKFCIDKKKNDDFCVKYTNIKLNPISDKLIILKNPKDRKSEVMIFEDVGEKNYFYNQLNFSLDFIDYLGKNIKFSLLRTKINFIINDKINSGGELIDISLPRKEDFEMKKLDSTEKFNNYIKKKIDVEYNEEYDFEYYIINMKYVIPDLFKIIFINSEFPWDDKKYEKRLARLIYFIFLITIDKCKVSFDNLNKIKKSFTYFINSVKNINNNQKNENEYLNDLILGINESRQKSPDFEKMNELIKKTIFYSNKIIEIIDSIYKYQKGNIKIDNIYNLGSIK